MHAAWTGEIRWPVVGLELNSEVCVALGFVRTAQELAVPSDGIFGNFRVLTRSCQRP